LATACYRGHTAERGGGLTRTAGVGDESRMPRAGPCSTVSCFYLAGGIYSIFALKRVARIGGRKPTFLLGRLEGSGHRHYSGSLRLDLEKIRDAAERVARSEGLEIFDVEWKVGKQRFLRVSIDRVPKAGAAMSDSAGQILAPSEAREGGQQGVSHADCQRVSQQLSVILDVEELIPGAAGYTLEVSSPGMDRPLRNAAEYERFRGRMAKISTVEPVENEKYFEGRLAGFVEGKVRLELKGKVARTVELPLEMIRKANLMVEF
jgi:ribosome maturation factor RimP